MKKFIAFMFIHIPTCLRAVTEASSCTNTASVQSTDCEDPKFFVNSHKILTNRPIIGVLTLETDNNVTQFGKQYMSANYVKFLESAGARVAPIFVNSTMEETEKIFRSLNGAVLPGGHVKLNVSRYTAVGKKLVELAREANSKGDVFPIWGECMGFELVAFVVSGANLCKKRFDWSLLNLTDALNVLLAQTLPSGRHQPVFLFQWHPVKQIFEWSTEKEYVHTQENVVVGQYFSNLFVNQARLSGHRFANEKEEKAALIYNYSPVYTGDIVGALQTYFW